LNPSGIERERRAERRNATKENKRQFILSTQSGVKDGEGVVCEGKVERWNGVPSASNRGCCGTRLGGILWEGEKEKEGGEEKKGSDAHHWSFVDVGGILNKKNCGCKREVVYFESDPVWVLGVIGVEERLRIFLGRGEYLCGLFSRGSGEIYKVCEKCITGIEEGVFFFF